MDATCRACGKPAETAATEGGEATCAACSERAQRRRLIFDVSASKTLGTAGRESAFEGPESPHEETRMLDLRDLVRLSRMSLATLPPQEEHDPPLSVHEAMLLVDSLSPLSVVPPVKAEVEASEPIEEVMPIEASEPAEEPSSKPTWTRWRAAYSGVALLVVMVGMVTAKARMSQDKASEARLAPEQPAPVAQMSSPQELPAADVSIAASTPIARASAAAAPTSTPHKPPVTRPLPPRPRAPAPAPVDTAESRAAAATEPTPHVVLLDAMQAAVSRRPAPPSPPKEDCLPTPGGGSGAPSPCARAAPRTSPLHP
jgi:hypothetical protein